MSEAPPPLVEQAVRPLADLTHKAAVNELWAIVVLIIALVAFLAALWIWRRGGRRDDAAEETPKPAHALRRATSPEPPRADIARLLVELDALRRQVDRLEAAIIRIHERIDDAQDRFASKGELEAAIRSFGQMTTEIERIVVLLRDRVMAGTAA